MRLIIAGGRNYELTPMDFEALDFLHRKHGVTQVLSGCATGADAGGVIWAEKNNIPVLRFKPDWDTFGPAAGPIRNEDMAEQADALFAFPGGTGTADMIRRAKAHHLKVFQKLAP